VCDKPIARHFHGMTLGKLALSYALADMPTRFRAVLSVSAGEEAIFAIAEDSNQRFQDSYCLFAAMACCVSVVKLSASASSQVCSITER
jgi:hypothetical protein